jgi:hypothetical protein
MEVLMLWYLVIGIVLLALFVWFFVLRPGGSAHVDQSKLKNARRDAFKTSGPSL